MSLRLRKLMQNGHDAFGASISFIRALYHPKKHEEGKTPFLLKLSLFFGTFNRFVRCVLAEDCVYNFVYLGAVVFRNFL